MGLPSLRGLQLVSALLFAGAALLAGVIIGACTSNEEQPQVEAVEQLTAQPQQPEPPEAQAAQQQQDQPEAQAAQPQPQPQHQAQPEPPAAQPPQDQPAVQVWGALGGNTLQLVLDRGAVKCGTRQYAPLFGTREPDGSISGFDADFCRALAAAVLGDLNAVEFVDASDAATRFELLNDGEVDVLIRTTTITASRDAGLGIDFAQPTFYGGQGFAVRADSDIRSTADMSGLTICVQSGTTTEQNLVDHFTSIEQPFTRMSGSDMEMQRAFLAGRCDVWTADTLVLAAHLVVQDEARDFVVLGQVISKEPLAPGVRDYDSQWKDIVNWVVHGLIAAEELGVTKANVSDYAEHPPNPTVARLLGVPYQGVQAADLGFGIDPQFIQRAIAAVGNYGEIYERTLGDALPRACSLNALAISDQTNCPTGVSGILYALPYR